MSGSKDAVASCWRPEVWLLKVSSKTEETQIFFPPDSLKLPFPYSPSALRLATAAFCGGGFGSSCLLTSSLRPNRISLSVSPSTCGWVSGLSCISGTQAWVWASTSDLQPRISYSRNGEDNTLVNKPIFWDYFYLFLRLFVLGLPKE